uniref:Uncharacterized protein n=1 Tax=Candidatus Kentrum sp. TUN TaxID=2126343 RepID=A0A451AR93_9GAMM|nr:MAG: hypothetical protein BECKTUN1418F_GA0071002_11753 [Candidatus Kentron sp. TUN]VFK68561.1 MAG: hypothetical protein BECKTUN1418E_GA0071001_11851 [Candidatus Kentron sp. TUN]
MNVHNACNNAITRTLPTCLPLANSTTGEIPDTLAKIIKSMFGNPNITRAWNSRNFQILDVSEKQRSWGKPVHDQKTTPCRSVSIF